MQENSVNRFYKGLNVDISPLDYKDGLYKFALNAVTKTAEGHNAFLSNEGSNKSLPFLKEGYIPIGKEYMGNNKVIIFSVNEVTRVSEIGIFDADSGYETYVNDENTPMGVKRLNFRITNQIDATYRLRRGCERTVYFTDNLNKPRYFNFDKVDNFKDATGKFDSVKFNLQKSVNHIPEYSNIEVLNSQGSLEPGSYNFAIQYLDESLNPSEIMSNSNIVKIYNDSLNEDYVRINGSINSDVDYENFPKTNKAIKLVLKGLDATYPFYRIVIIESNNGSGNINRILYSQQIPTSNDTFIYTGTNYASKGTLEEVLAVTDFIEKAAHIEQLENRLLLANTQGKDIDYCNLQKYASRIQADCIVKTVNINNLADKGSSKNPLQDVNGLGYMPGELYSFGIQYIFEDNTLSPVFHIPGRGNIDKSIKYTNGDNVFPMSSFENGGVNTYENKSSCGTNSYWGLDCDGTDLQGKKIRHHRFPLRSDLKLPLVKKKTDGSVSSTNKLYQLNFSVLGKLQIKTGRDFFKPFEITINYKNDGQNYVLTKIVDPAFYSVGEAENLNVEIVLTSQYHFRDDFSDIDINISNQNFNYSDSTKSNLFIGMANTVDLTQHSTNPFVNTKIVVGVSKKELKQEVGQNQYETQIFGIRFSNIDLPTLADTNNNKIIGYYIVRNERKEEDKTILDSGVLTQSVIHNKYLSHGLLVPETDQTRISGHLFGVINPEFKFNNKQYNSYDKIIQEGYFDVVERKYGKVNYDDVYDGSSYDKEHHSKNNDDAEPQDHNPTSRGLDGWSLSLITRDNIVEYKPLDKPKNLSNSQDDIEKIFYLDALGNNPVHKDSFEYYNTSADNKIGVIQFADDKSPNIPHEYKLPYVVFYKSNANAYSNFRLSPYYKEHQNPIYFEKDINNSIDVFNGDSYISSMRYCSTTFYDNRVSLRDGKKSLWKIIVGAFVALVGAVALVFSAGTSTILIGAGIALIGAATLLASAGIKQENFNKTYVEEYEKGLRDTVIDDWTDKFYNFRGTIPFGFSGNGGTGSSGHSDDTLMWIGEAITDLWFESSLNLNLRNKFVSNVTPTFLDSPGLIETGNNTPIGTIKLGDRDYTDSNSVRYPVSNLEKHICRKLLAYDPKRDDLKFYIGIALGEYYKINKDYLRKNKEKAYFHLPYEYDCCSKCRDKFPHRIHYSEQSFQEELSDNYRIFLPNNYRDIEGETGSITNLFKLNNNLYIHTEEALWQLPRNYQERVTDQITSFIGTGSYFEIPPQKILDSDSGFSAGCQHKWGSIKTPNGYFFISANQNKFYQFTGELKPISSIGMKSWFDNNTKSLAEQNYYKNNKRDYLFKDNPSNNIGTGFITTYDSLKERIILTKRDFNLSLPDKDYLLCTNSNNTTIFRNITQTIEDKKRDGWQFIGIENCQLKFKRDKKVVKNRKFYKLVEKKVVNAIKNDTDIVIYLDMSSSFNDTMRNHIVDTIIKWFNKFKMGNIDGYKDNGKQWEGNTYFVINKNDGDSERGFQIVQFFDVSTGNIKNPSTKSDYMDKVTILPIISNSELNSEITDKITLVKIDNKEKYKLQKGNTDWVDTDLQPGTVGSKINTNQLMLSFSNENARDYYTNVKVKVNYYYPNTIDKNGSYNNGLTNLNLNKVSESITGSSGGEVFYILEEDIKGYKNYVKAKKDKKESFNFVAYPTVFYGKTGNTTQDKIKDNYNKYNSSIYLQHSIACLKEDFFTELELKKVFGIDNNGNLNSCPNNGITNNNLWEILKKSLLNKDEGGNNGNISNNYLYKGIGGLEDFNMKVVTNASFNVEDTNTNPLKLEDFTKNMADILKGSTSTTYEIKEEEQNNNINYLVTEYSYVNGKEITDIDIKKNFWTLSYSLENEAWVSFHSYVPNMYIEIPNRFYSFLNPPTANLKESKLWEHNNIDSYQTFYGSQCQHIIEYVSVANPLITKVWNHIILNTEAKEYNEERNYFVEVDKTFNTAILYNSKQCSGYIKLIDKHTLDGNENFLSQQVNNPNTLILKSIIERREKDWFINDFRDMRVKYTLPIWDASSLNNNHLFYGNKLVDGIIDINKDWTQQEVFRDKFLVIRLIFDNFANLNLTTNYISENFQVSQH
jgi:hypothetical protein